MYPIGFHLIQKVETYIEAEDELDIVMVGDSNSETVGKQSSTTTTTTTTSVGSQNYGINSSATTSTHSIDVVVMGEEQDNCEEEGRPTLTQAPSEQGSHMTTVEGISTGNSCIDISAPVSEYKYLDGKTKKQKKIDNHSPTN